MAIKMNLTLESCLQQKKLKKADKKPIFSAKPEPAILKGLRSHALGRDGQANIFTYSRSRAPTHARDEFIVKKKFSN
jgi:hypothetical protein